MPLSRMGSCEKGWGLQGLLPPGLGPAGSGGCEWPSVNCGSVCGPGFSSRPSLFWVDFPHLRSLVHPEPARQPAQHHRGVPCSSRGPSSRSSHSTPTSGPHGSCPAIGFLPGGSYPHATFLVCSEAARSARSPLGLSWVWSHECRGTAQANSGPKVSEARAGDAGHTQGAGSQA